MWPWGHIAVAYLLYAGYGRLRGQDRPGEVVVLVLVFGSLFPDLVDKPLAWYGGFLPSGRSLAHSLVVLIPLCAAVYLVARQRDREDWGIAFGIGAISHVIVDALPALWRADADVAFLLYPLVGVDAYEDGPPTVIGLLRASATEPYFLLEFVLLGAALWLWHTHDYPGVRPVRRLLARE